MKLWKIVLLFVILCFSTNLYAEEEKKHQAEEWQIKGVLAAFNDPAPGVHAKALEKVAELDVADELSEEQLLKVIALLKNTAFNIRRIASNVLGKVNRDYIPMIGSLLEDRG